jgi:hypothetical protein
MFGNKKSRAQKLIDSGGAVAWATVLEAREKWQSETSGFKSVTITSHMHVKLRVEPEGEPPFEASFGQAFSDTMPFRGGICKVAYDPDDHSKISVIDGSCAPPGLSREQAEAASSRRAEMLDAVNSGHLAEYIQQRQAQAMSAFTAAAPSAPAPLHQPSVADQLTKLADLKDRGALTEAEFEAAKEKLLAES